MGEWIMTTYEQTPDGWTITEHRQSERTPKHGVHCMRIEYADEVWPVYVHDDTANGLDALTMRKMADRALHAPIYWSDERCRYWFYDFEVWGSWCELISTEGLEPFEIRAYD